jgi:hypothetical protein
MNGSFPPKRLIPKFEPSGVFPEDLFYFVIGYHLQRDRVLTVRENSNRYLIPATFRKEIFNRDGVNQDAITQESIDS